MAKARVAGITSEIEQYRRTRYVSAAEATWRMLGYEMMSRDPAVTVVHAHLEGEHNVMYPSNATDEFRRQCANDAVSDLMRYFKRPLDHIFNRLTLLDYFESYTITKKKKMIPFHLPRRLANGWIHTVTPSPKEKHHTSVAFSFSPLLWGTFLSTPHPPQKIR